MIDLYQPPRPAIILPGEPWQREVNRKLIAMGLGIAQRQAVVHALKALQHDRNRSSILKPTLDDLAKYSKTDVADLATLVPGVGASAVVGRQTATVPQIRDSTSGFNNTAAASNIVSFPAAAVAGDRFIIVYALQTNATADITHPAGYTVLLNNWATGASSGRLSVVYRDLQGADSPPTFGVASSTWRAAWVGICIKAGTFDPSASPSLSAATDSGASTNVQPASISVPGWSPYVSLLFVFGYWNHNIAVSSEPSGYSSVATGMGTTATGATAHIASNDQSVLGNYNATSGTPGPIVIASSSRYVSGTIVVKGA